MPLYFKRLLPHYFKYAGGIICIIVPGVSFFLLLEGVFDGMDKTFTKFLIFTGFTLGLLLIAFAREKMEDEMVVAMRSRAMAFTFIFSVIYFSFIKPLVGFAIDGTIKEVNSYEVMLVMLLTYILIFHFQRWRMK